MTPPPRPLRLDHLAFHTRNARATAEFWTQTMRCRLVAALASRSMVVSRLEYPYLHVFVELADGSHIAFFEVPDARPEARRAPPFDMTNHIAFHLDTVADVHAWKAWLMGKGVEVVGPADHGILLSIYFDDPTSNCRLEFTTSLARLSDADAADAATALDRWDALRDEAARRRIPFSALLRERLPQHSRIAG